MILFIGFSVRQETLQLINFKSLNGFTGGLIHSSISPIILSFLKTLMPTLIADYKEK